MRDSFIFKKQWRDGIDILSPTEQAEAYNAILDYALESKPYQGANVMIKMLLALITKQIDDNNTRYAEISEQRRQAANKRWEDANASKSIQEDANASKSTGCTNMHYDSDSDSDSDSVYDSVSDMNNTSLKESNKEKGKSKSKSTFKPPTLQEVTDYCLEKGYKIDAEYFVCHYQSNGWKQSNGNPIKDWKAAIVTWTKRQKQFNSKQENDKRYAAQHGTEPSNFDNLTESSFKFTDN